MPISEELNDLISMISVDLYENDFLDLSNQDLDDEDAEFLAYALKENTHIKKVNLRNNKIHDAGAISLSELSLKELDLSVNNISIDGSAALSKSNISFLNLSANPIGPEGSAHFAHSKFITRLSLSECEIGNAGATEVFKNPHITNLDLSTNDIDDDGVMGIPDNSKIVTLKLSQNLITADGARYIVKQKKLRNLCLDSNRVCDKSFEEFAKELTGSKTLKYLDLSQNSIRGNEFLLLCKDNTIEKLQLFNCRISFDKHDALPENSSLVELNLSGNALDDRCGQVFKDLLRMQKLENLDLSRNNIGKEGTAILKQYEKTSQHIDLSHNPIFIDKSDNEKKRVKKMEKAVGGCSLSARQEDGAGLSRVDTGIH